MLSSFGVDNIQAKDNVQKVIGEKIPLAAALLEDGCFGDDITMTSVHTHSHSKPPRDGISEEEFQKSLVAFLKPVISWDENWKSKMSLFESMQSIGTIGTTETQGQDLHTFGNVSMMSFSTNARLSNKDDEDHIDEDEIYDADELIGKDDINKSCAKNEGRHDVRRESINSATTVRAMNMKTRRLIKSDDIEEAQNDFDVSAKSSSSVIDDDKGFKGLDMKLMSYLNDSLGNLGLRQMDS